MKVTKCVWQFHNKQEELAPLFDYFRSITNEAIRVGEQKQISSRFRLHKEVYLKLRSDFYAKHVYGALYSASRILNQFRKLKRKNPNLKIPYARKQVLYLDNQTYKIKNSIIEIPIRTNQYCHIYLNQYVLKQITNSKLGIVTVTPTKLIISYSKHVHEQKSIHDVGIDCNVDKLLTFDTKNNVTAYGLQKVTILKERYRKVRAKFHRNDVRIRKKIFQKYGMKEKNKTRAILHSVSKRIVSQNMNVIMEDLTGVRRLYQKGNGRGKYLRAKLNSWPFYELQRQIEYKARWLGLSVKYVKASGTSSKCATCGSKMIPEEHRTLFCSCCNVVVDRDINAAKNILARGTWVVPAAVQSEAMKQSKDVEQIVLNQDSNKDLMNPKEYCSQ